MMCHGVFESAGHEDGVVGTSQCISHCSCKATWKPAPSSNKHWPLMLRPLTVREPEGHLVLCTWLDGGTPRTGNAAWPWHGPEMSDVGDVGSKVLKHDGPEIIQCMCHAKQPCVAAHNGTSTGLHSERSAQTAHQMLTDTTKDPTWPSFDLTELRPLPPSTPLMPNPAASIT